MIYEQKIREDFILKFKKLEPLLYASPARGGPRGECSGVAPSTRVHSRRVVTAITEQ